MPKLSNKTQKKAEGREVIYPKRRVTIADGEKAMTEDQAKKLLGWQAEPEDKGFGTEYDLKDKEGTKVRCCNNLNNRPLGLGWVGTLTQEHLRKRWRFNFEPIIIGKTGLLLSGQHRLISFVFACQLYRQSPELYPHLAEPPTLETAVAYGAEETDDVVNTLDTGKPRSLSDVIYRSGFFTELSKSDRAKTSRYLEHCVRMLWKRTGVKDAFGIERTHSESLDFIQRHPRTVEAVSHVTLEDDDGSLSRLVGSTGYASALMYLMGASSSDPQGYLDSDNPDESKLDFKLWETAEEFWTLLSSGKQLDVVRNSLRNLIENEEGSTGDERMAIVLKAWNVYVQGKAIADKDLTLKYETDEKGWKSLDESPTVGGIDFGGKRPDGILPEPAEEPEVIKEEPAEVKPVKTRKPRTKKAKLVKEEVPKSVRGLVNLEVK